MLAEMFKMQTGADIQIVPYKGASTLITDMIAGRIHGGFETTSVMLGPSARGQYPRPRRAARQPASPSFPTCPTMIESGVKGVEGSSWSGVLAPAGTPPRDRRAAARGHPRGAALARFRRQAQADGRRCAVDVGRANSASSSPANPTRIAAIMKAAGLKAQ